MNIVALSRYAPGFTIAAAVLASCGGSQPPIGAPGAMPQSRTISSDAEHGNEAPDYKVSGALLFVTNSDSPPYDAVTIYDAKADNPSPIAVINEDVAQANGDCVDAHGTLYVASEPESGPGWISEYALGETKPLRVITNGINTPAFCAIDRRGNLWVTNIGDATVTEYLKGATVPHFILKNRLTQPDGIAIDRNGNIYVGNLDPSGTSNVQAYPPGKKSPSRTITDGVTWPVGIAVDNEGTLYVTNDVSPCNIEEYRAGQSEPYQAITNDIDGPVALTFAKPGRLYEVNEGEQGCSGNGPWPVILEFRPHSLSPSKRAISNDLHVPIGVAYYPPLLP
jgi:sugar lactone lactonase YvrE